MNKEHVVKLYSWPEKMVMGLITLVVTGLPILFWVWIASYLTHSLIKIS